MGLLTIPRDDVTAELEVATRLGAALLFGPPGTGKTTLASMMADNILDPDYCAALIAQLEADKAAPLTEAERIEAEAAALGIPIYIFHSHPDAMFGEMVISYAPDHTGMWHEVMKPVLQAWGHGPTGRPGLLLVDDVHLLGPGGMAALYTAMDGARGASITLDDGRTLTPKPGYRCVLTMNGDPRMLDEPVLDRLWGIIPVMAPSTAMFDRLHPDIRALAQLDYDGKTATPAATYREWLAISELWQARGSLPRAVMMATGDEQRTAAMLETMAAFGIADAETAMAALVAEMPSGAPKGR